MRAKSFHRAPHRERPQETLQNTYSIKYKCKSVNGTPNCGKGEPNQVIRVGHASPACLFGDVEVFGGA